MGCSNLLSVSIPRGVRHRRGVHRVGVHGTGRFFGCQRSALVRLAAEHHPFQSAAVRMGTLPVHDSRCHRSGD